MTFIFLNYYFGWYTTLYLASNQMSLSAALIASLSVLAILIIRYLNNLSKFYRDFFLFFYVINIGLISESLFLHLSITHFNNETFFPPFWLLLLYPLFFLSIADYLPLLNKKWLSILCGCMAPISYFLAAKMGACTLPQGIAVTFFVIGVVWSILIFLISGLLKTIESVINESLRKFFYPTSLYMLYDGHCPICSKEVELLKNKPSKLEYIDIASPDFKDFCSVNYKMAMKEIVAIDQDRKIYIGTNAFHEIYLRRGFLFLGILFELPILKRVLTILYKIFAKYRLKLTGRNNPERL